MVAITSIRKIVKMTPGERDETINIGNGEGRRKEGGGGGMGGGRETVRQ